MCAADLAMAGGLLVLAVHAGLSAQRASRAQGRQQVSERALHLVHVIDQKNPNAHRSLSPNKVAIFEDGTMSPHYAAWSDLSL